MDPNWITLGGGVALLALLIALFFRSPNDQFKTLESRVQTLESARLVSSVDAGKLGNTIEHLSKVVAKLDSRLDDLTKTILQSMTDRNGSRGR